MKVFDRGHAFNGQHLQIRQHAVLTLHKLDLTGPAGTVRVTATEASLLNAFALSGNARVSLDDIAHCMGLPGGGDHRTNIQVRIVRLRKKLYAAGAQGAVIESIRNVGYQCFEPLVIRKA